MSLASILDFSFSFIIGAGRFIILLGLLIFLHELGHFFAAKLSNVYVVRFSLGWGKRLFGIQRGETDYCVSAIPIGGYVRMVGQEDMPRTEEEVIEAEPELADVPPERRFNNQPILNRLAISFSGPFMNLIFAFPVLWLVFVLGIQEPISSNYTRIGAVMEGSPAEQAGIRAGQRVLSIDGVPVEKWEEVLLTIMTNQGTPLNFELEDLSGNITHATVTPEHGEDSPRATIGIEGLEAVRVTIVNPDMPADKGGLRVGDMILASDGVPIASMRSFIEGINRSAGRSVSVTVLRENDIFELDLMPEETRSVEGILFDGNVIAFIDEEVAARDNLKLQIGDEVVAVNGTPFDVNAYDFNEFLSAALDESQSDELTLSVLRSQRAFSKPSDLSATIPIINKGMVGVGLSPFVIEKYGPVEAIGKSIEAFGDMVVFLTKTIYFIFSNKVSTRELAGPIGIAYMTERSLDIGIGYYLKLVAMITINLTIVNLLPIPMLDGGMIFLTILEAIRRKPLEEKYMLVLQRIGIAFILFIIVFATYNDMLRVVRYFLGGDFLG
jgi:regulator of sigma E protease